MSHFDAIRGAALHAPFFHLLYLGADVDRASHVRSIIEERAELRQFSQVSSWAQAASLLDEMRVGMYEGCLLILCDPKDLGGREIREWLATLSPWPSGQVMAFLVLEESPQLSFHDFLGLADRDFAGLGSFEACLETLRRWCSGKGDLDLGLAFTKSPSRWLRSLKHDYVSNTVLIYREVFEGLGLLMEQREIDLIGNVLRNLLCLSDSKLAVRSLAADREEEESDLFRRIYSTPVRLVAPARLESQLTAADYSAGQDFVCYQTLEEVGGFLEAAAREGCSSILLKSSDARFSGDAVGNPPVVLIDGEAPRLGWSGWQARLRENVIGSYAASDLARLRSHQPVLVAQRPSWRACAIRPLPDLFDRLVELLVLTHEAVEQGAPKLKEFVLRSLAAVCAARALYLGQTGTGDGS